MAMCVMPTRLSPDAIPEPSVIAELGQKVIDKLNAECPKAMWTASYAVLGPYDDLDLFEAPNNEISTKIAVVVRSSGHATTEIWPAPPWERFRHIARSAGE